MGNKKALYAGSFDPFTKGHLSIVEKSAELFDEVVIGIAYNSKKKRNTDINAMIEAIKKQVSDLDNVSVTCINGLVADWCREREYYYLVRGLRDTSDYLYEENVAKINKEINSNLRTIYFRSDNDVISSFMVRELCEYNKDVSKYVPEEIYKIL